MIRTTRNLIAMPSFALLAVSSATLNPAHADVATLSGSGCVVCVDVCGSQIHMDEMCQDAGCGESWGCFTEPIECVLEAAIMCGGAE